jgi:GAF domain-containing protein
VKFNKQSVRQRFSLVVKDDNIDQVMICNPRSQNLSREILYLLSDDTPHAPMRTSTPLIVGDAYSTYASFQTGDQTRYEVRGWMGVPMIIGDRVIGMLAFNKKESDYYSQEQSQFALAFAAQAAIAIENARLYSDAQKELYEKIQAEEKLLILQKKLEEQAIVIH